MSDQIEVVVVDFEQQLGTDDCHSAKIMFAVGIAFGVEIVVALQGLHDRGMTSVPNAITPLVSTTLPSGGSGPEGVIEFTNVFSVTYGFRDYRVQAGLFLAALKFGVVKVRGLGWQFWRYGHTCLQVGVGFPCLRRCIAGLFRWIGDRQAAARPASCLLPVHIFGGGGDEGAAA